MGGDENCPALVARVVWHCRSRGHRADRPFVECAKGIHTCRPRRKPISSLTAICQDLCAPSGPVQATAAAAANFVAAARYVSVAMRPRAMLILAQDVGGLHLACTSSNGQGAGWVGDDGELQCVPRSCLPHAALMLFGSRTLFAESLGDMYMETLKTVNEHHAE